MSQAMEELTSSLRPLRETWSAINDIIATINQFSGKMSEAQDLPRAKENANVASFGG